jgi:hypothetical protein
LPNYSNIALRALLTALVLGVLGDVLLNHRPWGLNVPLWTVAVLGATYGISRSLGVRLGSGFWWMAPVVALFSLCFAWRDADELKIANFFAMVFGIGVMLIYARSPKVREGSVFDYTLKLIAEWTLVLLHPIFLVDDIKWKEHFGKRRSKGAGQVLRGILLAFPLLIVFGALFASADAVFSRYLTSAFDFDTTQFFERALFAFGTAWVVAACLRRIVYVDSPLLTIPKADQPPPTPEPPSPFLPSSRLSITEVAIALGSLNVLFGVFVGIQFSYLFGGRSHVMVTQNLSFAEYARSGFFELVTVAGLVLPLVLFLHWLLHRESTRDEKIFRCLCGILLTMVFVIIASALERMRLYVDMYGLTHLRLYTTGFMIWLGLSLAWLLGTVLRGKEHRFAFGSALAGFGVIFGLNAINPDALIARVNLSSTRGTLDIGTLEGPGADAYPVIHQALPSLKADQREALQRMIDKAHRHDDWRSFNLGRSHAAEVVPLASVTPGANDR